MYRVKQTSTAVNTSFKPDERTPIFQEKINDKNLIQRNKLKTQMCKRMVETGKCLHGSNCHFAHSKDEIRKPICFFGEKCKNKSTCIYSHESEVIPELPKVEDLKFDKLKISEPVKEGDLAVELSTDTFKTHSNKEEEIEKLKALMKQSESDVYFREIMIDTMKAYLEKTFTTDNTVYLPCTGSKSVKFIAVECDDESFEDIVTYIVEKTN